MLINGATPIPLLGQFTIRRGDVSQAIQIRAVGADWDIKRDLQLPPPRAPMAFAREKGQLVRDDAGKVVQTEDVNDPDYRKAAQEHNTLVLVAYIYAGTIESESFKWETDKSLLSTEPRTFYKRLLQEIVDSHISQGELKQWFAAVYKLSNLTQEDVDAASANFQRN